jgi:hypothetical protein
MTARGAGRLMTGDGKKKKKQRKKAAGIAALQRERYNDVSKMKRKVFPE